jgi:hypothetical protein
MGLPELGFHLGLLGINQSIERIRFSLGHVHCTFLVSDCVTSLEMKELMLFNF